MEARGLVMRSLLEVHKWIHDEEVVTVRQYACFVSGTANQISIWFSIEMYTSRCLVDLRVVRIGSLYLISDLKSFTKKAGNHTDLKMETKLWLAKYKTSRRHNPQHEI